jgi:hypothetical protein
MSTLPTFKTLQASDFDAQYAGLINQLALIFNNDIQSLFSALNNGISLADNIACTVATVPITVDSNGNTTNSATFALTTPNTRVTGLTVINVTNTTNSSIYPTGAPFCSFTPASSQVTINNVTGLQTGYQWSITLIAWSSG